MQIKTRQGNDLKMQYEILIRHAADVCTLMVFEREYSIYFSLSLNLETRIPLYTMASTVGLQASCSSQGQGWLLNWAELLSHLFMFLFTLLYISKSA